MTALFANRTKRQTRAAAVGVLVVLGLILWGGIRLLTPAPDIAVRTAAAERVLADALQTGTIREDPIAMALPLPDVATADVRKALFIAALLPRIVRENARIEQQRALADSAPLASPAYAALAHAYGLEPTVSRSRLLRRVDVVPASLALAQAAIESGWGTSRFARQGNAFFGERTYDTDQPGMRPTALQGQKVLFKVKSFPSAALSVRSYMKTLNTHQAYAALRQQRADLRQRGTAPSGAALVQALHDYSELGAAYTDRISTTLHSNNFRAFDKLRQIVVE